MGDGFSPQRWANSLTTILNAAYRTLPGRFPVDVPVLARDYSAQRFPHEPIVLVVGDSLGDFDGALYRGSKGWGIIYNNAIASAGRINFTLAHEFGHYLLHRASFPDGLECGEQDIVRWDSEYRQIETQANEFAATLLMPLDDFRRQIDARAKPTFDDIGECAQRYGVSLIAATLRWLQYTERRAVLVVSRDGYVLWTRSSGRALKTGAFFRTANRSPLALPNDALGNYPGLLEKSRGQLHHDAGVWFRGEGCEEIALVSDRYDFAVSLLHLEPSRSGASPEEDPEEDVVAVMEQRTAGRL